jgi:acyl-CoA dehydrogenase
MDLQPSTEERLLADSARAFAQSQSHAGGEPRHLWRSLGELGFAGAMAPEEEGGSGLGLPAMAVILEEFGKVRLVTPLASSLLATSVFELLNTEGFAQEWPRRIAAGRAIVALAHAERYQRHDIIRIETKAVPDGNGYAISGEKINVLDGPDADALLITARLEGPPSDAAGVIVCLAERGAPGMSIERRTLMDGRCAARVCLDGLSVSPPSVTPLSTGARAVLEVVHDRAAVALCAEMVGGMQRAFDMTVDYLRQREQFGHLPRRGAACRTGGRSCGRFSGFRQSRLPCEGDLL